MRIPGGVTPAVVLTAGLAAVLCAALCSCAAAPSPGPRVTPNAVERQALVKAARYLPQTDGPVDWLQLWTISQAGPVIESCVDSLSSGVVKADVGFSPTGDFAYTFTFDLDSTDATAIQRYASSIGATSVVNECRARTPIDDRVSRVPASRADALYSYDRTVLRRCLIERGQPIDPVPSRSQFLGQFRAGTPWSPYDQVRVSTRREWYSLSDACPAIPPELSVD